MGILGIFTTVTGNKDSGQSLHRLFFASLFIFALILGFFIFLPGCSNHDFNGEHEYLSQNKNNSNMTLGTLFPLPKKSYSLKHGLFSSAAFEPEFSYHRSAFGQKFASDSISIEKADSAGSKSSNIEFSETNNQVKGIDEGDIIKTDGNYIYTLSNNALFVVKAYPENKIKKVLELRFNSTTDFVRDLLLFDGKLLLILNHYDYTSGYLYNRGSTSVKVYSTAGLDSGEGLKELSQLSFAGSYYKSRKKGSSAYILTQKAGYRVMPMTKAYYFNMPYRSPVELDVNAISIDNMKTATKKFIVDTDITSLYMSENNIYLAFRKYIDRYEIEESWLVNVSYSYLNDSEKALVSEILSINPQILSANEKKEKIYNVFQRALLRLGEDERKKLILESQKMTNKTLEKIHYLDYTYIIKLSYDGLNLNIKGNADVPGNIVNQFSLGEFGGNLAAVTTSRSRWENGTTLYKDRVGLFVFDKSMRLKSKIDNVVSDERVYSSRFVGSYLFLVTYKQVDPFFVISLEDPDKPKVEGYVKIPGYSNYLHMYDNNTVIGIGSDNSKLKIELYDISDIKNPKAVARFLNDDSSYSKAQYDHHAFLLDSKKGLLVLPVISYGYGRWDKSKGYAGAFVFNITKDRIILKGLIDHTKNNSVYLGQVERSLFIDSILYTKSQYLLRANSLSTLKGIKDISLDAKRFKVY